jgi:hypothetical protein
VYRDVRRTIEQRALKAALADELAAAAERAVESPVEESMAALRKALERYRRASG